MASRVISAVLKFKDQNFSSGLRQANRQAGDFGRQVSSVQNKLSDFHKSAKNSFKAIGTAAAALGTGAVAGLAASVAQSVLEMEDAFGKLQAQTGATGADLKNLKDAAKETFSKGYGESLTEVSEAVARVKQNMHEIDGSEIANVTSKAMLLANTFDSDVNEVTRGTNNLMQAFGTSAETAFDLFTTGGQRGLNFSNEMFDNVAEYASLFGNMGYSAEEYFGIMERGAQAGVYNLDFLQDSMKEFQIRVKDGSKSTNEAMKEMSKETQSVWKDFMDGKGAVSDVASTVIGELKGMEDQIAAGQIAVSLFGTKFEDVESKAMYAMLGSQDAMKGFEGSAKAAADAIEQSFGNRIKSAFRDTTLSIASLADNKEGKEFLDSLASTAEGLVPKIVSVAEKAIELGNTFKNNWGPIKETIIGITTAVVAFKVGMVGMSIVATVTKFMVGYRNAVIAGTGAMFLFNNVVKANPIGFFVTVASAAVAVGVLLYRNWDTVTAKTKEVWASIGGLEGAMRTITGPIGIVIGAAVDLAKNWDSTKSVWENVWGAMARSAAETVNSVIGGINSMIDLINKLPGVNIPVVAKVDWGSASAQIAGDKKVYTAASKAAEMASFDVGSNRITHDQVAQVHKDEMIIPASKAEVVRSLGGNIDNIDRMVNKTNRPSTVVQEVQATTDKKEIPSFDSLIKGVNTAFDKFDIFTSNLFSSNRSTDKENVSEASGNEIVVPSRRVQREQKTEGKLPDIEKMVSRQPQVNVLPSQPQNNEGKGTVSIVIEKIEAMGVTTSEVVGEIVTELKLALANI